MDKKMGENLLSEVKLPRSRLTLSTFRGDIYLPKAKASLRKEDNNNNKRAESSETVMSWQYFTTANNKGDKHESVNKFESNLIRKAPTMPVISFVVIVSQKCV